MSPIGVITSANSPIDVVMTLDTERSIPLYEYVMYELEEHDVGAVNVIGQVISITRSPYELKRDLPIFDVMKSISRNVMEVSTARVKVLGYRVGSEIRLPRTPPRVGTYVYLAPDNIVREFYEVGDRALCIGHLAARSSIEACLDPRGIRRHLAIMAATGSGKTWASVLLIEELLKLGATILVVDPHGEYVPIKGSARKLGDVSVRVVKVVEHQDGDVLYRIGVIDAHPDALADAAGVPSNAKKIRYFIWRAAKILKLLRKQGVVRRVGPDDLIEFLDRLATGRLRQWVSSIKASQLGKVLEVVDELERLAKSNRHSIVSAAMYLRRLKRSGVFSSSTTPLSQLLSPGVTIMNLAGVPEEIQDYVTYHVLRRVMRARIRYVRRLKGVKYEYPVVVILEEAHRFVPPKRVRRTWSYNSVVQIASEGRKFGVYLIAITQRPSRVDPDVLSQLQSQIILRMVNPKDQEAVRESSELVAQELLDNLPGLNVGEAIITGPITRFPLVVRLRDRVLEYGGGDIDVVAEWSTKASAGRDVLHLAKSLWKRKLGRPIRVEYIRSLDKLKVLELELSNGILRGVVEEDGAKIDVEILDDFAYCSECGSEGCRHLFALLVEAAKRKAVVVDE